MAWCVEYVDLSTSPYRSCEARVNYVLAGFARYDTFDEAVYEDSLLIETRDYLVVGLMFGWIPGEPETRVVH